VRHLLRLGHGFELELHGLGFVTNLTMFEDILRYLSISAAYMRAPLLVPGLLHLDGLLLGLVRLELELALLGLHAA